jgi:MoaA/NifB/PqqE/SkfB family radical SAM enzyme
MLDANLLRAYNAVRTTPHKSIFCHAPFASMNFAQSGDVTVCCYNRTYTLGTYPSDTIERMWKGPAARQLRESMLHNDLPRGCDICMSQFASGNFSGLRARSFDYLAEAYDRVEGTPFAFPKVMEFEISNACNLECTMCTGFFSSSIRHNREKLPPLKNPYDDAFVAQLEPFVPHLRAARFLGGEPFLVRTYYQIWDLFIRLNRGIEISITTNATTLNDRIKGILDKLRAHIIVSIDSLQPARYESIRVNAHHAEVMRNIDYFRRYASRNGTTLTLAVCPMRHNWDELPALVDYCNARGIQIYFNTVVYPGDAAFMYMPGDELERVCAFLESSAPPATGSALHRSNGANYADMVRQVVSYRNDKRRWHTSPPVEIAPEAWRLVAAEGQIADLSHLPQSSDVMRVRIAASDEPPAGCARLVSEPMSFRADRRYLIGFRARAGGDLRLTARAEQAGEPYEVIDRMECGLTEEWRRFEIEFAPEHDHDDGQLCFELGTSPGEIDVADVAVRVGPA